MGNYLEETIESVLCNLQKGDEYFVTDGSSTETVLRLYANMNNMYFLQKEEDNLEKLILKKLSIFGVF